MPEHLRNTIELQALDDLEIDEIFQKIELLENQGKLTKIYRELTIDEIKMLCKEKFGRHLLVALLQIRKGKRFPDIIREECRSLEEVDPSKFSLYTYCVVCLFNTLGVPIYDDMVFHTFKKDWRDGWTELNNNCAGIILTHRNHLLARHDIIANEVFKAYYKGNPELILATLKNIFDLEYYQEIKDDDFRVFVTNFWGAKELHQKLLKCFTQDVEGPREFYNHFLNYFKSDKRLRQLYLGSFGLFEKAVANYEGAIKIFNEIVKINPRSSFVYRMLAYAHLDLLHWNESASNALLAFDNSREEDEKFDAAKILSYNKYDNFLKAERIYKSLKSSKDLKIKSECEKYFSCLEAIRKLRVSEDSTIQQFILEKIRPRMVNLRSFITASSQNPKIDLYDVLAQQQDQLSADYEELNAVREEFDSINDLKIKGLFYRMLACALRKKLDNMEEFVSSEEIENLFRRSISLNEEDCFARNYYGTFCKDVKEDYLFAENEYRAALSIGDKLNNEDYHRHPKFLNDLALLLIKQVEKGIKDEKAYKEAESLLEEAVAKVNSNNAKFTYPKENLMALRQKLKSTYF